MVEMETINASKTVKMKKLIYILSFLPLSLMAQMGIGTTEPTAMLEIQTETDGIAALELVPQTNPSGRNTGQMAVIDNKLFLFDAARDKWLSVENTTLEYGRLGAGSDPAEIEFGGGDLQNGPRMPFDGTIVGITISATDDDNQREVTLFKNGVAVANNNLLPELDGVFVLNPFTLQYRNSSYNLDFNAGDMLSFAIDSAVNDIDELVIKLDIKWRVDNN